MPFPAALLALLLQGAPHRPVVAATASAQPSLVVLIAIDQLRGDYLDRFGRELTGGLGRLARSGAFFPDARQDHAITQTAPGHSTMLSGRFPAHTGIATNELGVPDTLARLIEVDDTAVGASPRRFFGTELYDWMLARDPEARVLSVSRKDRGAILPVGRARGDVWWFAAGRFTTSRYYRDSLPPWVRAYNARRGPERLAGTRWELLRPATAYPEPDSPEWEADGREAEFPHPMPGDPRAAALAVHDFPWMDSLTLDFALEGVQRTGIGRRPRPDLLVVSLSALDYIGHDFGPDSREVHDHLLRLDRWLGLFLDSLATTVPPERMLLALTADHGMSPAPERAMARGGGEGGRIWLRDLAPGLNRAYGERFRTDFEFHFDYGLLMADVAALRQRGIDVARLSDSLARDVAKRTGVLRVYTPRSLAAAPDSDVYAGRWRRTIPASMGWLVAAVSRPHYLWTSRTRGSNHGSPHLSDQSIPILFVGPGIRPRRYERVVRSVDIAPTLAALLGLRPTEPLDGRPIPEVAGAASGRP
jgi:predicted AlkP superfamily pyrophosphatase or phosphodiesterase